MSFVKMPQDDYVAMCNKLRSMLNETDKYTSKNFIEKMDELIVDIEEGGNPNYVETIKGTLANPWGDLSYTSLVHAIQLREVTALLSVVLPDDSTWILPLIPRMWADLTNLTLIASAAYPVGLLPQVTMMGGCVVYELDSGDCAAIIVSSPDTNYQWVNLMQQMSQLPTTLTIIHHPLPDNGT